MRRQLGTAIALAIFGVVAACSPATSASPSGTSPLATQPIAADCRAVDLRTPSGSTLDLTGTWTGGNTLHDIRQLGDCVWWVGRSTWPNQDLGSAWRNVFFGHVHADFTLTGEWVDVYRDPHYGGGRGQGVAVFAIQTSIVDGAEVVVLHRENTLQLEERGLDYVADTLRRVD